MKTSVKNLNLSSLNVPLETPLNSNLDQYEKENDLTKNNIQIPSDHQVIEDIKVDNNFSDIE
jgi:hypothetical protein